MSSQYGESSIILQHFDGRPGRFLDVGAGDGLTFSNTEPLLRLGWTGVMVEPAPSQLRWLYENHGENPAVTIVPCAVGEGSRTQGVNFWDGGHNGKEFSTANAGHRDLMAAHSQGDIKFRQTRVVQLSWWDLIGITPGPFDFVNIDVEGNNFELLASMPFHMIRPEMVCIELDPAWMKDQFTSVFTGAGLNQHVVCGGNLLAWR